MRQKHRIISSILVAILFISTATVLPVVSKSNNLGLTKGIFEEYKTDESNCCVYGELITKFNIEESFSVKKILETINKSFNFDGENSNSFNFEIFNNNLINLNSSTLILFLIIFIWNFIIGAVAVSNPGFLPFFVKYFEIVSVGTLIGVIVDILIWMYQGNYEIINDGFENIISNQNISSFIININKYVVNLTKLPGVRGGIAAFCGIMTSLEFLSLWEVYKILQMLGGGLFISAPVIISVLIYILFIDYTLTRAYQHNII